jgi:hypothetical protein
MTRRNPATDVAPLVAVRHVLAGMRPIAWVEPGRLPPVDSAWPQSMVEWWLSHPLPPGAGEMWHRARTRELERLRQRKQEGQP